MSKQNKQSNNMEGLISVGDLGLLEQLCISYSFMRDLEEKVREEGATLKSEGRSYLNPNYRAWMDIQKRYIDLCAKFGLSPADRSRVSIDPPEVYDKWDEYTL